MGNIITAAQLPRMLEVGIKVKSLEAMNEEFKYSAANKLFTDQMTDRERIDALTTMTIGKHEKFTGSLSYDNVEQGHFGQFYNYEYCTGMAIQQKFIRTNQYKQMWPRMSMELGLSYARTVEDESMKVFRNANNTTTVTLPDGQALSSTAHPSAYDSSDTQSNQTTSALSRTVLETIAIAGSRWKTPKNEVLGARFDTILIPPDLQFTMERINNTTLGGTSGGSNLDVNVQKGRWNIIVSDYLTDTNNYFVIDSGRMRMNLYRNWVAKQEINAVEDFDTFAAKWSSYCFFGLEVDDWTWIYCGIVS